MMLNWDDPLAAPIPRVNGHKPQLKVVDVVDEPVVEVVNREISTETQVAESTPAQPQASATQVTGAASTPVEEAATNAKAPRSARKAFTAEPFKPQQPVRAEDKRVINGSGDINQLAPFKYPWAWEFFLNANKNHWTPLDINMAQDVHDYHHNLKPEEVHVYENVLAYLTTSDILAMRNIGLAVMEKMTAPELQIYQARQVYEEALHTWTYQHCIETIGLDQGEIYNRYRVVPEINGKIQMANRRLNDALRHDIDLKNRDDLHDFVLSYTFFAGIFEGCWFYNGFSPIFALQRRGLMKGTAEQLQYIMRDEVLHCSFGIRVVRQIMQEENVKLDPQAVRDMWDEAEAAEQAYARFLLPNPILGYNAEDHSQQFRFIANRRARQLGMEEPFPGAQNALPWLDEQSNMRKEKNFFETRVTEYQTGGALKWD
ncbi:MAG: ribonucleotide-diphosphate reductase subunit beta [Gammaproteobacteria bacterium]|nr:ribonucleotide-diphosphate reductase subunit beta [Gammaproteobacteria bacterium]MBU1724873.1 ribonucleotide-diphosphate reductase subunit beta [Gammaproteobacteria bacterium]MBU2004923.1 ribonucleotide-diphosphate reductase subunit beta [Gammaproteobacteria bacterium]